MTTRYTVFFTCATLAGLFLFTFAPFVFAEVTTDKDDYSPGETVAISGDGYWAGETVLIEVTAPYGSVSGTATVNGSGEFVWSFVLPGNDTALGNYSYTATGQASGIAQSGTFTDGNVKVFPLPTTVTFTLTKTVYSSATCTGAIVDGPDVETGVSDPSGETTGVGNAESVKLQAAAFSDQGGAFIGWTTASPFVSTSTTVVSGDTLCVSGNFTGNRSYFANYGNPPGVLVVKKVLINDNGGSAATSTFSFQINGASTTPFNTQGEVSFSLASSTYSITELAAAGYTTTYGNSKNGNANCTNLAVVSNATTTCTITNNDQPGTLIIKKVLINDNGGSAATTTFSYKVNGGTSTFFETDAQNDESVNAGSYSVVEDAVLGYTTTYSNSENGNTDCESLSVPNGGSVTCTITNNDEAPTITLIKNVDNGDGGNAGVNDFGLTIGGTPVNSGDTLGVTANTPIAINETGLTGYTFVSITGDAKCPTILGGTATLDEGEGITCTITNDDIAPKLTIVKDPTNDSGGNALPDDFLLTVDGSPVSSGVASTLSANTPYAIDETILPGYSFVSITGDAKCPTLLGGTITLDEGDDITCTITNDDQPGTLVVQKVVINDNGGSTATTTFAFQVNAGGSQNFEVDGENELTVDAGTYSVVEDAAAGYTTTYSNSENGDANCDNLSVPNGGTVTCIVTNNDIAAVPPPISACSAAPLSSVSIRITVCNNGSISSNTSAFSDTGGNSTAGSQGGSGGTGGSVSAGVGNSNNGGAAGGSGGTGGRGSRGGIITTGNANTSAAATNSTNRTIIQGR